MIDAEGHYEGKYAAADRFVRALRARIGEEFPVSLATFPYVDYHPSFPYSVFFGPGGATYNQPQMYWRAIETSVRSVYEHTYLFNRLWDVPLYPLGQTYGGANRREIRLFRRFGVSYGGLQPSWWDWQETTNAGWRALGADNLGPVAGYRPVTTHPLLKRGSRGDLVVWAQEHLRAAGENVPVTGVFGKITRAAVRDFQKQAGPEARRRDRHRDLGGADPLRTGPLALGRPQGEARPRRRDPEPRDPAQPPALGLAARQGLRDSIPARDPEPPRRPDPGRPDARP